VRRCLLIRHLSHGEDSRLNRCPGSVDHYSGSKVRRHYLHHDYAKEKTEAWRLLGEKIETIIAISNNIPEPSVHTASSHRHGNVSKV
ncbi:hypothetical protein ACOWPX_13445, partial [Pseudomonas aeruginosa]